jgi:ABC-type transport system involved in cytochrome c biogenesis permease subunit
MTVTPLQGITHVCFGLSYLFALLFEVGRIARPAAGLRWVGLAFGAVGLLAHTFYIFLNWPTPAEPYGSLLLLAWVIALFYLWGTVNHAKQAWAIFVLPVVIGFVALSYALVSPGETNPEFIPSWASGERFWGIIHGTLIFLAAVGVSVGFVASVMYLIQARRLRKKLNPGRVIPMLSLERLERMNRRALNLAFPLLTIGLLVGTLLLRHNHDIGDNWLSLKVLSTAGLWVVFLVLVYLRYGAHVPPRRLALLSVVAFALMLVALVASHPFAVGGVQ